MSSGQSSNQTSELGPTLARLAKALATALQERGTKQNSEKCKWEASPRISSTKWPYKDWLANPFEMALMTTTASPSNIT